MNPISYQQAFQILRQAGFVGIEIERLCRLRNTYRCSELDQAPLDQKRLYFVRWLVATGRLTDQLPEENQNVTPSADERAIPRSAEPRSGRFLP